MSHYALAAVGATLLLTFAATAGLVVAGPGVSEILFRYIPGAPFGGWSFTDPADFTCVNGNVPQHNPPTSFERRCTPNFPTSQCDQLQVQGTIAGAFFASSLEAISSCGNAAGADLATCTAVGPAYPATCAAGPSTGSVPSAFTWHCHLKPSGAALLFGATCRANVN